MRLPGAIFGIFIPGEAHCRNSMAFCGVNHIFHEWLLDKYLILSKGHSQLKWQVKESLWTQPWDMRIFPVAISQSKRDKFPEIEQKVSTL